MKALVIQTAFIGDVILTLPLVDCLKKKPDIQSIDYVTKPHGYNILETNPNINSIIVYDKHGMDKGIANIFRFADKLKKCRYDIAYIPHRSLRSALVAFLAGIPERIGFDKSAASFLYTRKIKYRQDIHEVERNLSLMDADMKECGEIPPVIHFSGLDKKTVSAFFQSHSITGNIIGIAPGSQWETKRWMEEGFAELVRRIRKKTDCTPLLFGSVHDKELCDEIQKISDYHAVNTAGEFTARQSALAMSRANVVVSNDSGAAHIAVAGGSPVIMIYGPTMPGFGFSPYGKEHIIVEKNIPCRPCGIHGGEKCPEKHFRCMKEISVDDVFHQVMKFL